MQKSIRELRKYLPILLLIAITITVFFQIKSSPSSPVIDYDLIFVEGTILIIAVYAYITLRNIYHYLIDFGLALFIYVLSVHLIEEIYYNFSIPELIFLTIILILGLIFMLTGLINTRNQYEENIIRYQIQESELKEHLTELSNLKDLLYQANKKILLLISLTRHDLLNQLTIIQMENDLAIEEINASDSENIQRYLDGIMNASKRIEEIIRFTIDYEEIGLSSHVWQNINKIISSSQSEINLEGIIIKNTIPDDFEVNADPIIRKIFSTLLENSVRHGGENLSHIRLSLVKSEKNSIIVYEDDGIGIRAEEKEAIFDLEYGTHTGIGLFLAREILSITGLSIKEVGIFGKGVRFEIIIPEGKIRRK